MTCPKCEEGTLTKVQYKGINEYSLLCEFCGAVWHEREMITKFSGHVFESQNNSEKPEYSFDDIDLDQESKDIKYARFK